MNKTFTTCILCGSGSLKPLKGYEAHFLSRCRNCGFVFSTRNPTPEELEKHYDGYGRNDYLSEITVKRYHELLNRFESVRKTNRLLDVGCGIGYFLEVAKERGWEVYGTEYTDLAIEICESKGISMRKGPLDPADYSPESFDVITSFEVIEHINTPRNEMEHITAILRPGGYFYVTTPNFNSLLRYYLKAEYNIIGWPEHLSYYTPVTLHRLMKLHGLKKVFIQSTGFSLTRLDTSKKPAETVTNHTLIGQDTQDEKIRRRFETNRLMNLLKKSINKTLTLTGKGDALKGLFRK